MESIVLAVLAFACGAAAAFIAALVHFNRREPAEPHDWTEEAYQPRHDQPRAITRIHANDLDWEIK